jgi:hypothetical protein
VNYHAFRRTETREGCSLTSLVPALPFAFAIVVFCAVQVWLCFTIALKFLLKFMFGKVLQQYSRDSRFGFWPDILTEKRPVLGIYSD